MRNTTFSYATLSLRQWLCLACGLISMGLHAQTTFLQHADSCFKEYFLMLENSRVVLEDPVGLEEEQPADSVDKNKMFMLLYESYVHYYRAFSVSPRGTKEYDTAKKALVELHPHLQNGAAWFSRLEDPVATNYSTKFARAYADLILDYDMQDIPSMQAQNCNYFPTMVFFAGSNSFNENNFKAAIHYFTAYLKTGEEKRREYATQLLEAARKYMEEVVTKTSEAAQDKSGIAAPDYMDYLQAYMVPRLEQWKQKSQFESTRDYKARIDTVNRKIQQLYREGTEEYAERFTKPFVREELFLENYDADNQVFPVKTPYGEVFLPVPRAEGEAQLFARAWKSIQVKDPVYGMAYDNFSLSKLTFVLPTGQEYQYDFAHMPKIQDVKPLPQPQEQMGDVALEPTQNLLSRPPAPPSGPAKSDVDMGIPLNKVNNENTFAIIIANENYKYVAQVPMALNDGDVFAKYCERTLGIKQEHIRIHTNATYGEISMAVDDIQRISRGRSGDLRVIFYYAGHGLPNRSSHDAFLLPIDSDGKNTEVCYPLSKLYAELASTEAQSVVVFLDACFSGASLEEKGRGKIIVKPKAEKPSGNMIVFSAATDEQIAHPYIEQSHGLFTYYLLKRLKDTKGRTTLKDLDVYISTRVKEHASVRLHEEQTPTVNVSPSLSERWAKTRLIP